VYSYSRSEPKNLQQGLASTIRVKPTTGYIDHICGFTFSGTDMKRVRMFEYWDSI